MEINHVLIVEDDKEIEGRRTDLSAKSGVCRISGNRWN